MRIDEAGGDRRPGGIEPVEGAGVAPGRDERLRQGVPGLHLRADRDAMAGGQAGSSCTRTAADWPAVSASKQSTTSST